MKKILGWFVLFVVAFSSFPMNVFAWDLSTLSYDSVSFSAAAQDTDVSDVFFKADGTKMYILTRQNQKVLQYSLSTAWDISTASYDSKQLSVGGQAATPEGLFFKPDGTVAYVLAQSRVLYQYTLSTPWDISTASYASISFSVGSTSPAWNVFFKPDGLKMYIGVSGGADTDIRQYSLTSAWDISTASYDNVRFTTTSQTNNPFGVFFNSGGTKMYLLSTSPRTVFQYSVSTPWDLSTVTYDSVSGSVTQDANPFGIFFKPDGKKMYMAGRNGNRVYQYSLTDSTAPYTTSFGPGDGTTGVSTTTNLIINFSESVAAGTGTITIKKSSDNSTVETISANSSQVSIDTYSVTINPNTTLEGNTDYYIQISSTAFKDLSDNAYAGISNTTTWNFTTGAAAPSNSSSNTTSASSAHPPSCNDIAPSNSPDLFQLNSAGNSATLYFVPVSGSNTKYYVSYGLSPNAEGFGVMFDYADRSGVIPYTVNALFPGTWYFKVRGQNGCMPGSWSQIRQVNIFSGKSFAQAPAGKPPVLGASTSASCSEYTVQSGDSLWSIASTKLNDGFQYQKIIQQNNLPSSLIHTGQKLKVGC